MRWLIKRWRDRGLLLGPRRLSSHTFAAAVTTVFLLVRSRAPRGVRPRSFLTALTGL